jgi:hypothetical protein
VAEACETCHDESYRQALGEWDNEMKSLAESAHRKLTSFRQYLQQSGGESRLTKSDREKLATLSEVISTLPPRTAIHNTLLSQSLLEKAVQELDALDRSVRSAR